MNADVPIPAKNALIAQVTSKWPAIMRESLQRMVPIVREVVVVQVQAHFGRFRENNLSANVESVTECEIMFSHVEIVLCLEPSSTT